MKNILTIALLLFISFKSFCQRSIYGEVFPPMKNSTLLGARPEYSDTIPINSGDANNANTYIYNYLNGNAFIRYRSGLTYNKVVYFLCDAGTLLYYLYSYQFCADRNIIRFRSTQDNTLRTGIIRDVAFSFGYDIDNKYLTLVITGADSLGNCIYLPTGALTYCLQCISNDDDPNCNAPGTLFSNTVIPTSINQEGVSFGTSLFPHYRQIEDYSTFVTKEKAIEMKSNYIPSAPPFNTIEPTNTFRLDAYALANFIYSTPGIQDIQFILARRDNLPPDTRNLTLVIVGIDINGRQIYKDLNNMVLENCYPCPDQCTFGKKETILKK